MKRKTVSLCMIARDEESSIGKAIKSVLALVDEIIVVDTGSRDNTRIIAEGYGARVIDFPWREDFAAARNAALAEASCDWILVLDTDEQLQGVRPVEFQRLLHERLAVGYRVRLMTDRGGAPASRFPLVRLFRSHPDCRYRYPVHEQITPSLAVVAAAEGLQILDSPLVILHGQADGDARTQKRERNLRLLRKAMARHPEEPYFEFQLASEALSKLDEEALPVAGLGTSRNHLESAWRKVSAQPEVLRRLLTYGDYLAADLAAAMLAEGRADDAAEVLRRAQADWGRCPHLLLQSAAAGLARLRTMEGTRERAALAGEIGRDLADLQVLGMSNTVFTDPRLTALHPLRYLGELYLEQGEITRAAECFEQALSQEPQYTFAWLGLAECARYAGDRQRALKLYLRAVTANEWNHRAWLRGYDLMEDLGFHDNAESWRRRVADRFTELPAAREILAISG
jgi:tetratricopeptide (TPR) repeat protein